MSHHEGAFGLREQPATTIRILRLTRLSALRSSPSQRLWWALWLVMLLPLAQAAASWHGISHVRVDASEIDGKRALHLTHCDLCITAVAVHGGAVPSPSGMPMVARAEETAPARTNAPAWIAAPAHLYESRGPPHLLS